MPHQPKYVTEELPDNIERLKAKMWEYEEIVRGFLPGDTYLSILQYRISEVQTRINQKQSRKDTAVLKRFAWVGMIAAIIAAIIGIL